jgi:hypothetical protein
MVSTHISLFTGDYYGRFCLVLHLVHVPLSMHGTEQDTPTTLHSFYIAALAHMQFFPALVCFSTCRFGLANHSRDLTSRSLRAF